MEYEIERMLKRIDSEVHEIMQRLEYIKIAKFEIKRILEEKDKRNDSTKLTETR